jgi:hypothetical protein
MGLYATPVSLTGHASVPPPCTRSTEYLHSHPKGRLQLDVAVGAAFIATVGYGLLS